MMNKILLCVVILTIFVSNAKTCNTNNNKCPQAELIEFGACYDNNIDCLRQGGTGNVRECESVCKSNVPDNKEFCNWNGAICMYNLKGCEKRYKCECKYIAA